ncbi:MAG TPA: DUF3037 domain-containing protein [Sediminibacterium sp.]|nr:DUF3037 domain-containing protein [Sediminibacterium sp.]
MCKNDLFEYAVIRIVPRVEREEFLNAGVVLYCAAQQFLQVRYCIHTDRIRALHADADTTEIAELLHAFEQICKGEKSCKSPIASLSIAERFRWLTATRSTIVQCSQVHPGLTQDALQTLQKIYHQQVDCA